MKKKVALLLAVIMVLSLLPMNVFGAGRITPVQSSYDWKARATNIQFEAARLVGQGADGAIRLGLFINNSDGGHVGAFPDANGTNIVSFAPMYAGSEWGGQSGANGERFTISSPGSVLAANNVAIVPQLTVRAYNEAVLDLHVVDAAALAALGDVDPTMAQLDGMRVNVPPTIGEIHIQGLMIRVNEGTPTLSVVLNPFAAANLRVTLIDNHPLAAVPEPGIAITANDPINFQNPAFVRPIRFTERTVKALDANAPVAPNEQQRWITLIAPRDYGFNINMGGQLGGPQFTITQNNVWTGGNITPGTVLESWHNGVYHRLDIPFTMPARQADPVGSMLGWIELQGLVLVPLTGAPLTGNVNIHVSYNAVATQGEININRNNFNVQNLHVATRVDAVLDLSIDGSAPTLPSGRYPAADYHATDAAGRPITAAGAPEPGSATTFNPTGGPGATQLWGHTRQGWPENHNTRYVFNEEVRSALIQVTELAPGAFDSGVINSAIEFAIDQPGVQIRAARWRITGLTGTPSNAAIPVGMAGHINPVPDPGHGNADGDWATVLQPRENAFLHWFRLVNPPANPLSPTAQQQFATAGTGHIFRNTFSLVIPRTWEVPRTRTLEVQFALSIEAGYEWKYDGAPIEVTVSGPAVQALPEGNRSVIIADVADPIVLTLDGSPIQMGVGNVFNIVAPTDFPDIVISETAVGNLRRGQEIFVGIAAIPTGVIGHPVLETEASNVTVDLESGMRIDVVRTTLYHGQAGGGVGGTHGTGYTTGVRITVVRESSVIHPQPSPLPTTASWVQFSPVLSMLHS